MSSVAPALPNFQMSFADARGHLKELRDAKSRDSWEILQIGRPLVDKKKNASQLGEELWVVYEQLFIAALDCGKADSALKYLKKLTDQFPSSMRVTRLHGMYHESTENYDEATKIYDEILEKDPTFGLVHKRKVAVLKAQRQVPEAIEALTEYLKDFMSDHEAWLELADLYVSQLDFKHAAFCMEELILVSPQMPLFHQRYAEILYSMGGAENIEMARKYFAQALKLNPDCSRSLYGFFMAAAALSGSKATSTKTKKDSKAMASWAQEKLLAKYPEAESQRHLVEKGLQNILSGIEKEVKKPQKAEYSEFEFKMNTGQTV